jgi:hypothetical protein
MMVARATRSEMMVSPVGCQGVGVEDGGMVVRSKGVGCKWEIFVGDGDAEQMN